MMVQPSEDNINSVQEFTACDRQTAIIFLKGNSNDVEKAVNALFNDPDPKRYENAVSWDESQFSSDRNGGNELKVVNPPFDAGDTSGGIAPSRPPSRTQHASSQIEQEPPSYGTVGPSWETKKASEDFEGVDEAIQRSLQDQGSTGIKRDLVRKEIVPDAEAPARERRSSEPVFLKPLVNGDFLPALIVILHDIPSCRNALLAPGHLLDDYGYNESWWAGDSIKPPAMIYRQDESGGEKPVRPSVPPLVSETQRLMAFLERTDRAYGSAEGLAQILGLDLSSRAQTGTPTILQNFMEAWDRSNPDHPLFKFSVTNVEEKGESSSLCHLRIGHTGANSIPLPATASTFSDVLDNTLWEKGDHGQFDFAHLLETLPSILVIDAAQHSGQAVEIPATLNLGRFMLSKKDQLESIKRENAVYIDEIRSIDETLQRIRPIRPEGVRGPANERRDAIGMLKDSIQYLKERQESGDSRAEAVKNGNAVRKFEAILADIQARVDVLNKGREEAQHGLQPVADLVTESDKPEAANAFDGTCSHYVLSGVATSAYQQLEVFITSRKAETTPPAPKRWWRMAYDTRKSRPEITKELVNESHVLSIATKGLHRTLLVYANAQRLLPVGHLPLPEPLQTFIATDNATFRDELESATTVPIVLDAEAMQGISSSSETIGGSRRGSSGSSTRVELSDDEGIDVRMGENRVGVMTPTSRSSTHLMDLSSDGPAPQEMQEIKPAGAGLMGLGEHGMGRGG